jgi:hypothetical protein
MHPEHAEEGLQPHFVAEKYFFSEHLPSTNRVVDHARRAHGDAGSPFLVEDVMRQARSAGLDEAVLGSGR